MKNTFVKFLLLAFTIFAKAQYSRQIVIGGIDFV